MTDIKKVFRSEEVETWALNDISLKICRGEFVAIMGPSGCGKSTLLNIMGLLDTPTSGTYTLEGKDVSRLDETDRINFRKGIIGFVFQSFNLIDELTVEENIGLPLLYLGIPKKERTKRVQEVMERIGISHRLQDMNDIIQEIAPGRIDIKPQTFYNFVAREYDVIIAMTVIIYILAVISIVTTMAAIYAGVSLDTRRRRKEMALRKLSGAGPKQIAMIFMRTYLWIIIVAAIFAFPLCSLAAEWLQSTVFTALNSGNTALAYISGLIIILAVTAFTIAWKIRDIMRADPIEYLKD